MKLFLQSARLQQQKYTWHWPGFCSGNVWNVGVTASDKVCPSTVVTVAVLWRCEGVISDVFLFCTRVRSKTLTNYVRQMWRLWLLCGDVWEWSPMLSIFCTRIRSNILAEAKRFYKGFTRWALSRAPFVTFFTSFRGDPHVVLCWRTGRLHDDLSRV